MTFLISRRAGQTISGDIVKSLIPCLGNKSQIITISTRHVTIDFETSQQYILFFFVNVSNMDTDFLFLSPKSSDFEFKIQMDFTLNFIDL
jgi:hypothetical protein